MVRSKTAMHLLEGIAALALTAAAAVPAHAEEAPRTAQIIRMDLALPSQQLGVSLRALALQSGRTVLADAQLVDGVAAPALRGTFTIEEALTALLEGSGLVFAPVYGGFAVRREHDDPDAGQPVRGDDIVVTGSRLRGGAIASPVVRVGAQDIRDSGQTSLGDVVRRIPQSFGGGQNPGIGMNVPTASGIDIGGGSSVNLRGLGSDATLTLLNGRRMAYTAVSQSIDVSGIPTVAVDRIEVVPDGASAIYGSDAVAGVANIILRRDYDGLETGARLAGTTDGGDFQQQYGILAGRKWAGGGLFAAYEYGSSSAITAGQRDYAASRSPGLDMFPALRHHSVVASAHQALSASLTFEIDGLYNIRWSDQTFPTMAGGNLDAGRATFSSKDKSFAFAPTLRLDLAGGWQATLGATYGRERVDYHQLECALAACNDSGRSFYRNTAKSVEISADGDLLPLPGGTAKIAIGGGYRDIGFERFAGEGSGINAVASQDSLFAFAEASLPLVGPEQGLPFMTRLDASAAVRYERYPGIGEVATPKLGVTWTVTPDVSLKGSWGKSFRAPTLYQQYQPQAAYLYPSTALGANDASAAAGVILVLGGNPDLKPERATTYSTTLALHPKALPGASLEISYFDVSYRQRVVTPVRLLSQALSNPVYRDQIVRDPGASAQTAAIAGAATFLNLTGFPYDPDNVVAIIDNTSVNAGRQRARGIDVLASYETAVAPGQHLRMSANVAWLKSDQQLSASQPTYALAGTIFNPPHWRGQASVAWTGGDLTLAGNVNYIGGVADTRFTPVEHIGGMTTLDLTARYRVAADTPALGGLEFSLSVQNLFNAGPDPIATSIPYDTPYDSTNYSPVGRMIAVGATKTW